MRTLSASELMNVWERGLDQPLVQRALTILSAACPETPTDVLAKLSIGQRDARLLTIREWTFGSQLVSLSNCPSCGERLELTFNVSDIRVGSETEPDGILSLSIGGYKVQFRLPNSLDMEVIADGQDMSLNRHLLLERCVLEVLFEGEEGTIDRLPPEVIDTLEEQMAQADRQADVELALSCCECNHQWQVNFDILAFFWNEIAAWAQRILREVHQLASAYHWREKDILSMSPLRRQYYLEMVSK